MPSTYPTMQNASIIREQINKMNIAMILIPLQINICWKENITPKYVHKQTIPKSGKHMRNESVQLRSEYLLFVCSVFFFILITPLCILFLLCLSDHYYQTHLFDYIIIIPYRMKFVKKNMEERRKNKFIKEKKNKFIKEKKSTYIKMDLFSQNNILIINKKKNY